MTTLRILHLTDTHLFGDGTLHYDVADNTASYRNLLDKLAYLGELDVVVLSGDVSDDGSPASYRTVKELTEQFAAARGALAVYAIGNHDQRPGFWEVLGNGHPAAEPAADCHRPVTGMTHHGGWRVVTLDTSVPGRTYGHVDPAQLEWVRGLGRDGEAAGTVVVLHHPPVAPVTPLHHGIELQNPDQVLAALEGLGVTAILAGHYHHGLVETVRLGTELVPVVVGEGICNITDATAGPELERAELASGATLVDVRADGTVRVLPLRPAKDPLVYEFSGEGLTDFIERIRITGEQRRELEW